MSNKFKAILVSRDEDKKQSVEIVELDESSAERLLQYTKEFTDMGLELEAFGAGVISVQATPALLGEVNCQKLIRDLADD
ncbi:MAG: hypothetical protein L3J32_10145, partial [Rhizobiaceae bacterium]|nr:hypothetical protein [Rhizobiaceae bacterium]